MKSVSKKHTRGIRMSELFCFGAPPLHRLYRYKIVLSTSVNSVLINWIELSQNRREVVLK